MVERIECLVIGAGAVGLAVGRTLARRGREVLLLEAESAIGTGISSRNSEVIHAGIYYPPGSAKASLCLEGRRRLYTYCEAHGVSVRRCGKLIVATDEAQLPKLEAIAQTASANGVEDLQWLDAEQAKRLEPALRCAAALLSPSTGILDTHAFMLSLQGEIEAAGGTVLCRAPVTGGAVDGILRLQAGTGESMMEIAAAVVINCAGLHAQQVARRIGVAPQYIPPLHYAKGNYYVLNGRSPFQRLIYPIPESGGLGVHLTLDLAGGTRFGPDVEWIERLDYSVDPGRAAHFYREIRRYWAALPDGALQPAYAGIRPKLSGPGAPPADFLIQGNEAHGVRGLVNLYGIESPGLTASLALAELVADAVQE